MKEKFIENKLTQAVKTENGLCLKFISPGMAGVPDRLVLLPGGKNGVCGSKSTGRKAKGLTEGGT